MTPADQADSTERLVNLAMYLSAARAPVTWGDIRSEVAGYPSQQTRETFLRMFERDKKELRQAGLVIDSDAEGNYLLDESATYASELELNAEESAAVRAAAAAFVDDPGFPFAHDLRMAMAKLGSTITPSAKVTARIADETPEDQGNTAASLAEAARTCKQATFEYTTSLGTNATRHVEPYGTFVRDGRWYMVGRDLDREAVRTFTVARIQELEVNQARPTTPDFERPADFDIASFVLLPFQFGAEEFDAVIDFDSEVGWRASSLTAGRGNLVPGADGACVWTVSASSRSRLTRWVVENGPGIRILEPPEAVVEARKGLEEVRSAHE